MHGSCWSTYRFISWVEEENICFCRRCLERPADDESNGPDSGWATVPNLKGGHEGGTKLGHVLYHLIGQVVRVRDLFRRHNPRQK